MDSTCESFVNEAAVWHSQGFNRQVGDQIWTFSGPGAKLVAFGDRATANFSPCLTYNYFELAQFEIHPSIRERKGRKYNSSTIFPAYSMHTRLILFTCIVKNFKRVVQCWPWIKPECVFLLLEYKASQN